MVKGCLKFADGTKFGVAANPPEDSIQQKLNALEKLEEMNKAQFNKDKCRVLQLQQKWKAHRLDDEYASQQQCMWTDSWDTGGL